MSSVATNYSVVPTTLPTAYIDDTRNHFEYQNDSKSLEYICLLPTDQWYDANDNETDITHSIHNPKYMMDCHLLLRCLFPEIPYRELIERNLFKRNFEHIKSNLLQYFTVTQRYHCHATHLVLSMNDNTFPTILGLSVCALGFPIPIARCILFSGFYYDLAVNEALLIASFLWLSLINHNILKFY